MIELTKLIEKQGLKIDSIEVKDFGTIIRACGEAKLQEARKQAFDQGWKTPISCHREEGSCEAFMIVWNKTK